MVSGDTATDPFMMMIAPVERFDTSSGMATANFCEIRDSVQVRTVTTVPRNLDSSVENLHDNAVLASTQAIR